MQNKSSIHFHMKSQYLYNNLRTGSRVGIDVSSSKEASVFDVSITNCQLTHSAFALHSGNA